MPTSKTSKFLDYALPELVHALSNEAMPGSNNLEEIKGTLSAVLVTRLADAIDRHERAASRLAAQVLILNCVLGVFTIAGSVLAAVQIFR